MRYIFIFLFLPLIAFGYQKGDTVSDDIQKQLKLEKNKIYIISFFASWCTACKKEIPHLSKLNTALDSGEIEIIGIDVDENTQKGQAFQKALKDAGNLNFKVFDDPTSKIITQFNPIAMPAIFLIKEYKITDTFIGAKDQIDKVLLDAISL